MHAAPNCCTSSADPQREYPKCGKFAITVRPSRALPLPNLRTVGTAAHAVAPPPPRTMTYLDVPLSARKPVRLSITIPHATYCELNRAATQQGRSMSNLAAHLLQVGLAGMD